MNKEWMELIGKFGVEGARAKFEKICTMLYKQKYSSQNVRNVEVKRGDGGIDIFIGQIAIEPISIVQCKFFPNGIGKVQENQITNSFKTAIQSPNYKVKEWTLCVANTLTIDENILWSSWSTKMKMQYSLPDDFILLSDGDDLELSLQKNDLYNIAFEKIDSNKISDIHSELFSSFNIEELKETFSKTSFYVSKLKNCFGEKQETHIERAEVETIIKWLNEEIPPKEKNVLIVNGEKGNGKTIVLKDVYEKFLDRDNLLLYIKADKYADETPQGLERKLFLDNNLSFPKIKKIIKDKGAKLIVIIDQLDALSQTLSANREYLNTYNRIIAELEDVDDIKVVISVRSFDLEYDAGLCLYNNNEYKKVTIGTLSDENVIKVLNAYGVIYKPKQLVELLRTPNHLDIFCKLPNKHKVNIDSLYSSKDLFDKLWTDIISSHPELKNKDLLYKIADDMYENEQKIVVQNNFNDAYFQELSYLKSNQIIIEENNEIQFFHQTMYDYCFSRQFIDKGNKLQTYIIDNGQSIYVRSVVKMIIEYLRDATSKEYIDTIKDILTSPNYRFHIKTLLLSTLATIQNPTKKEKHLATDVILDDEMYSDIFIASIRSDGWLRFIIDENLFQNNLQAKSALAYQFFRKNISYNPVSVIQYIEGINDFEGKNGLIENILSLNENWQEPELVPYFEKYITYHSDNNKINLWYFDILKKITQSNFDYSLARIRKILLDTYKTASLYNHLDHHLSELIKVLNSYNSSSTFNVLLQVYIDVIDSAKYTRQYEDVGCPFYLSYKSYPKSFSRGRSETLEDYLTNHIINWAKKDDGFIAFFQQHKETNSLHLLSLLAEGLKENVINYSEQIFELFETVYSKNGLKGTDDSFQYLLRKLIGAAFFSFSDLQKESVLEIINTVSSPYELPYIWTSPLNQNKRVINSIGRRKYLFLKSIPLSRLNKHQQTKKVFLELSRKYEPIEDDRPLDEGFGISISGSVPPLPVSAYSNMSLDDWLRSMRKFDENYEVEHMSERGGLYEHANEFSNEIKLNPTKYAQFINELFEQDSVSKIYILYGLDGLLEGDYEIDYVKMIFKKLIKVNFLNYYQYRLISTAKKIIAKGSLDNDVFSYLQNIVKSKEKFKEDEETDTTKESLVSVRSEAISAIILCNQNNEFGEKIFDIIEQAMVEDNVSISLSIIRKIAYLNHVDIARAFEIFMNLTNTDNVEILRSSLWSAHYFNNKFHKEMYPYFEKIMKYEKLHQYGNELVLSWLNDNINDRELYDEFITKSQSAKLCAIDIAERNLFSSSHEFNNKALSILFQFLDQDDENEKGENDFSFAYSGVILRQFKDEDLFPIGLNFFKAYSLSKHCKNSPAYFLEYLIKCSKLYPLECFTLLRNIDFSIVPNAANSGYYRAEPIKLLLAIYSVLSRKPSSYKTEINEVLDLFDDLMKNNHLREASHEAIELVLN